MEPIKFFNLQKNNKKSDTQPDYRISFKTADTFIEGGACWIKKDKKGNNFLSCKLADAWKDHTDESKSRKGWHFEVDGLANKPEEGYITPETAQGDEELEF